MAKSKNASAPKGSFAVKFESTTGECPHCGGLPTLRVENDAAETIGYVVADWPWDTDIPEDPSKHPAEPHYVREYFAQDSQGREILGVTSEDPHFIARAIHDAQRQRLAG